MQSSSSLNEQSALLAQQWADIIAGNGHQYSNWQQQLGRASRALVITRFELANVSVAQCLSASIFVCLYSFVCCGMGSTCMYICMYVNKN